VSDGAGNDATGIDVKSFEAMDASKELQAYINILDVFDGLPGIQTLKKATIERCHIREGMSILDAGCGTGLETVRLARLVGSSGSVIGLDASRNLLAEASRRA
jgi:ubiquinone/menaquinone biosynthesis C-methylase UbiE